jgi:hypothetical protein
MQVGKLKLLKYSVKHPAIVGCMLTQPDKVAFIRANLSNTEIVELITKSNAFYPVLLQILV